MAEETLAARPDEHGDPGRHELGERRQELEVVTDGLPEPDPGVDVDLVDPRRPREPRPPLEELPDLPDDVVVVGIPLHVGGSALAVHGNEPGAVLGGDLRQAGGDVVQERRPCGKGRVGDLGLGRVDRHSDLACQGLDDGQDAAELLGRR